jgi:anti-sigma-K factor RskA
MSLEANDIISSGLLELYAAGLTNPEETRQVEAMATRYPAVKAEIAAIEAALEAHAMAQATAPSPNVRQRVLAAIAAEGQKQGATGQVVGWIGPMRSKRPRYQWLAAAAVLLLAVGLGIVFLYKPDPKQPDVAVKPAEPKPSTRNVIAEHVDMENKMRQDQGFVKIVLKKAANAPVNCDATIYWNKQTGELYFDPCHLPNAPTGKQYQLWAMVNGKPVSAGVVLTDGPAGKFVIQKMQPFTDAGSFAVTLEKTGGEPTPTPGQTYVTGQA